VPFGTQAVFDISNVLPDEVGIGQFLRAILGYSAAPEASTLAVHLAYLVIVLALYLRPARPAVPPAPKAVEAPTGTEPVRS
jgi:high-affinity Fe2+/Pb2+ permease